MKSKIFGLIGGFMLLTSVAANAQYASNSFEDAMAFLANNPTSLTWFYAALDDQIEVISDAKTGITYCVRSRVCPWTGEIIQEIVVFDTKSGTFVPLYRMNTPLKFAPEQLPQQNSSKIPRNAPQITPASPKRQSSAVKLARF